MNENEAVLLRMIAERLTNNNGATRGLWNLLYGDTQNELLLIAPEFFGKHVNTREARIQTIKAIYIMLERR